MVATNRYDLIIITVNIMLTFFTIKSTIMNGYGRHSHSTGLLVIK